jgi:hypothetical protein
MTSLIHARAHGLREVVYFILIIPWEPREAWRTDWHPTQEGGRFDPRSCGAFPSKRQARAWAKEHGIQRYRMRRVSYLV